MDVFLSWSGKRSNKLAQIFYDWVGNVLPTIDIYYSTVEISAGERWSENIGKGLQNNTIGIFFLVEENLTSPWLNFEAGAISTNSNESRIIPLLHELKPEQISGPLTQFQAKTYEKDDLYKVVRQVNHGIKDERKIDEDKLLEIFDKWYPDFEELYKKFKKSNSKVIETEVKGILNEEGQIGEILNIVREMQREREPKTNKISQREYFKIKNIDNPYYESLVANDDLVFSGNTSKKEKQIIDEHYGNLKHDLNRRPTIAELAAAIGVDIDTLSGMVTTL